VPSGGSCLRLTARADLTSAEIERAAAVVRRAVTTPLASEPADTSDAHALGRKEQT
jgi:hypothetical protein